MSALPMSLATKNLVLDDDSLKKIGSAESFGSINKLAGLYSSGGRLGIGREIMLGLFYCSILWENRSIHFENFSLFSAMRLLDKRRRVAKRIFKVKSHSEDASLPFVAKAFFAYCSVFWMTVIFSILALIDGQIPFMIPARLALGELFLGIPLFAALTTFLNRRNDKLVSVKIEAGDDMINRIGLNIEALMN